MTDLGSQVLVRSLPTRMGELGFSLLSDWPLIYPLAAAIVIKSDEISQNFGRRIEKIFEQNDFREV